MLVFSLWALKEWYNRKHLSTTKVSLITEFKSMQMISLSSIIEYLVFGHTHFCKEVYTFNSKTSRYTVKDTRGHKIIDYKCCENTYLTITESQTSGVFTQKLRVMYSDSHRPRCGKEVEREKQKSQGLKCGRATGKSKGVQTCVPHLLVSDAPGGETPPLPISWCAL